MNKSNLFETIANKNLFSNRIHQPHFTTISHYFVMRMPFRSEFNTVTKLKYCLNTRPKLVESEISRKQFGGKSVIGTIRAIVYFVSCCLHNPFCRNNVIHTTTNNCCTSITCYDIAWLVRRIVAMAEGVRFS